MKARYLLFLVFANTLYGMEETTIDYTHDLREAVARLDFDRVQSALVLGADVHYVDNERNTFLHHAVIRAERCDEAQQRQRIVPIIELLIKHGAPVNAENVRGRVPLYTAAYLDAKPLIDCLRKHGAHDTALDNNGVSILDAFLYGWKCRQLLTADMEAMRVLLKDGANPNGARDRKGFPLHHAVQTLDYKKARLLLQYGADPDAQAASGKRPLHYLVESTSCHNDSDDVALFELANTLLFYGADVDGMDLSGNTALHYAANRRLEKWMTFLLLYRAQLGARNTVSFTPLHCLYHGGILSKYKRDFVHSILFIAARNQVKYIALEDYSTEELIEYFLETICQVVSMETKSGIKAMQIQPSRVMSSLVDPDLVREHFYDDAVIFCKDLKQERMQTNALSKSQAQDLKSLRNSV